MKKIPQLNIHNIKNLEMHNRYPLSAYKADDIKLWSQDELWEVYDAIQLWHKENMGKMKVELEDVNGNDDILRHHLETGKALIATLAVLRCALFNLRRGF
jgi:hypothetical protein